MKKYLSYKSFTLILFLFLYVACREKYVPQLNSPNTGYLVVEGFINSGTGPTTITLSRTTKLTDTTVIIKETKASVRVEGKTNTASFLLTETSPGTYTYPQLALNASDQYRLRITTFNGKQYVSDYSTVRSTIDIDSVSWKEENGGVQIYANAHDAANKTKYYRYVYDETWEFHSAYTTSLKVFLRNGNPDHVGYRDSSTGRIDSSFYRCWKLQTSYNILINTTEKLTQDVVSLFPLLFIERGSWKISVLYSINLKQYAMSQEAYRFYEQLRKNTQQLGSIFDAQPSDNTGNIHPISNNGEIVIGFVEVTQEKQKRIYIDNKLFPTWNYDPGCEELNTPNTPDSVKYNIGDFNIPTKDFPTPQGNLFRINYSTNGCVDCRTKGVNTKPAFWPL